MIKFQGIGAQGNYSQAGRAVADDTLRAFLAARRNSPNYGEIALTGAELRKKEKLATLKNQTEVAATRLAADTEVKAKKMQIDSASKVKSAKRKAGALAVAGQMATEAGALFGQEKRQLRELGGDDTYYNNQTALINKRRGEIETRMKEGYGTKSEPPTESPTSQTLSSNGTEKDSWGGLQHVIRSVEGTLGDKGYTTRFGGAQFEDLSKHPNIGAPTGWGTTSEAAGAFQFMKPTWDEASTALGLTDFSRESQQKAGRYLTERRGVNPDQRFTTFDEFSGAISKLSPEWAGLPNTTTGRTGFHGQANTSMQEAWSMYQDYFK